MADEQRDADQPSLELPSLFRREPRPPRPRRQLSLPALGPLPAAALTGVVVGLLAVGLTWLAERGCVELRGTSIRSCNISALGRAQASVSRLASVGRDVAFCVMSSVP